ncbi:50S ribosomal protein L7/L12 [candidate division LCP-89 bacterium B3_LCP]|uniref:Large ribosomal subunit protein bL12 n=1 Tax=candidate division LCP-89 bacterium B3_LCP TaxID=2012998 RepID=A0A532UZP6_UNCL8|nr:MAG: 50S ribosomal protein L7/L12 [candidate division LCP-89 bacterium B3_LCP]
MAVEEIIQAIEKMTVLDLVKLKEALEERFGVTAAAPVAMAAPVAGAAAPVEEKTEFEVVLSAIGDKKIQVIKVVRQLTGLGLKEAKEVVDTAPSTVKESATKEEADSIKEKLEAEGATVEFK